MTRLKQSLRKYWYIVLGVLIAIVLLARRGAILRRISTLRAKLLASQRSLDEIEYQQKIAKSETRLANLDAQAAQARAAIASTHSEIKDLHNEYAATTGRINTARDWEALERLRTEGNQR